MRLSRTLLAATLTATAWLSSLSAPAAAQTITTTTTTTSAEPTPTPAPDGCRAPATPPPTAAVEWTTLALPVAPAASVAPVALPPPATATPLSQASVLLMPQEQTLADQGSWVRKGNELILSHRDTTRGRRAGMLGAGIALLSMGYTPALITGGLMTMIEGPTATGSTLLIPVVGPFLSGLAAMGNSREIGLGRDGAQVWGWSWMLVDGAVQVTGLALLLAGGRSRSGQAPSFVERVQVLPYSNQNGGGVVISGRF